MPLTGCEVPNFYEEGSISGIIDFINPTLMQRYKTLITTDLPLREAEYCTRMYGTH